MYYTMIIALYNINFFSISGWNFKQNYKKMFVQIHHIITQFQYIVEIYMFYHN